MKQFKYTIPNFNRRTPEAQHKLLSDLYNFKMDEPQRIKFDNGNGHMTMEANNKPTLRAKHIAMILILNNKELKGAANE